jgi:hypothetical protein
MIDRPGVTIGNTKALLSAVNSSFKRTITTHATSRHQYQFETRRIKSLFLIQEYVLFPTKFTSVC